MLEFVKENFFIAKIKVDIWLKILYTIYDRYFL